MNLTEILNAQGIAEEVVTSILTAMRENNIFTASEENLDIRYGKLKTDHEGVKQQLGQANATIEDLKKLTKGQEAAQQKLTAYEQQIAQMQAEMEQTKIDAAARYGLLTAGADDVDYVLFKLNEMLKAKGEKMTLDDNEKIKGWDDHLAALKTQLPARFKSDSGDDGYQVYQPNKLKGGDGGEPAITKERFMGMGYEERLALKQKNEKLYNEMMK